MKTLNASSAVSGGRRKLHHKDMYYICSTIQRFKSWFILAIRNADLQLDGINVSVEDTIIHYSTLISKVFPYGPLHPKLVNSLTIFNREEFDDLFGIPRRLAFEKDTGLNLSACRFSVCQRHCAPPDKNVNCSVYNITSTRELESRGKVFIERQKPDRAS